MQILNRYIGEVIYESDLTTMKELVEEAVANKISLFGAYLRGANLSGAYLSGAYLTRANLGGADLSGVNLSGANLSGAYLSRADLSRADLTGANLSGANLSGADLSGADLIGANLIGANLIGANLSGATGVTIFQYARHLAVSWKLGDVKWINIGCHSHSAAHWLAEYKAIGTREGYTKAQIAEYGRFIGAENGKPSFLNKVRKFLGV